MNRKQKKMLFRILLSAALTAVLLLLPLDGWVRLCVFLVPYLIIGYDILIKAGKGLLQAQLLDENFLMSLATVGAIVLGEYVEGVAVMLFYQIGELFQSYAVGKSRRSIGELMDVRPDVANLEGADGSVEECSPDEVPIGSVIVVRPGERVPIDGVVIEGASALDTAALTGESMARTVGMGDSIHSGCINKDGVLRVRTTHAFEESTASRILALVEDASARKSRSENFITSFARIYTPAVCICALLLAVVPPLFCMLVLQISPAWEAWIYRALTFLVISCPCALVVSVPLTFFAGIGGASREGILVKGSGYLERLATVKQIAFDKTGTLTEGRFSVSEIHPVGVEARTLLRYAALAEVHSSHPVAQSIKEAWGEPLDPACVFEVHEAGGMGVIAVVDGKRVAVGNAALLAREGMTAPTEVFEGTVVCVGVDGKYLGCLTLSDCIKEGARESVRALLLAGIRRTVMLTGDARAVGERVAAELGIDEVQCELLPDEKLSAMEKMIGSCRKGESVAFVGDGINDSPVLSRADVGIAMGGLGSDAAIEAADVVLMNDDPRRIPQAIRIARGCMRIVRQNVVFAIGVKLICLLLGAIGLAGVWLAIFADVGVMVLAVLNAIRALFIK